MVKKCMIWSPTMTEKPNQLLGSYGSVIFITSKLGLFKRPQKLKVRISDLINSGSKIKKYGLGDNIT